MTLQTTLRSVLLACALLAGSAAPGRATAVTADTLKNDIDAFFHRMQLFAPGRVHWDGADTIEVGQSGSEASAKIVNARFSIRDDPADPKPKATVTFDHIDISERPATSGGDMTEATISLPNAAIVATDGNEVDVHLDAAKAIVLLEGDAERQRDITLDIAAVRLEAKGRPDRVSLGPIAGSWKTVRNADGSWRGPFELELKDLAFSLPETPLEGAVARIAYRGETAGPSLAELDAFRDRAAEVRDNFQDEPEKRGQEMLALLPKVFAIFSYSRGNLIVEQVKAGRPGGETLVTLEKAWIGGGMDGLDRDKASLRVTFGHDGLALGASVLPENRVPRSADLDFGIEDLAMGTVRTIAEAASQGGPGVAQEERQKAFQQVLANAMTLQPVFRIYDAMVNFKTVAIDASGEARRAPPPPIGYAASADVTVRGFDALADIATAEFARTFLPLIKFLGSAATAADGAPVLVFHAASAMGKPLQLNGNDISAWFATKAAAGQPRVLRLQLPPLSGDDVRAVQHALGPGDGGPLDDGVYDGATAVAVARYQKRAGLDVNGVVDAATREKLGIAPPPAPPASKN